MVSRAVLHLEQVTLQSRKLRRSSVSIELVILSPLAPDTVNNIPARLTLILTTSPTLTKSLKQATELQPPLKVGTARRAIRGPTIDKTTVISFCSGQLNHLSNYYQMKV